MAHPLPDLVSDGEAKPPQRRVIAPDYTLARVEHDLSLRWQQHPGAIDLPRLVDVQSEQILGDRLDRDR
jgi:hypothetical protein